MTKVYELPNGHRMVADIDESTRVCNITETTLDRLVSELNYYADGKADVLDKIRAEIEANMESIIGKYDSNTPTRDKPSAKIERNSAREECLQIIDKYIAGMRKGADR